jgi:hypothetical protein
MKFKTSQLESKQASMSVTLALEMVLMVEGRWDIRAKPVGSWPPRATTR